MTPLQAERAYQIAGQNPTQQLTGQKNAATDAPDFTQMVAEVVQPAVDGGRASDSAIASVASGGGDIVDVVTAISETELALETLVSVRDRVISAYEEIMRMPI